MTGAEIFTAALFAVSGVSLVSIAGSLIRSSRTLRAGGDGGPAPIEARMPVPVAAPVYISEEFQAL